MVLLADTSHACISIIAFSIPSNGVSTESAIGLRNLHADGCAVRGISANAVVTRSAVLKDAGSSQSNVRHAYTRQTFVDAAGVRTRIVSRQRGAEFIIQEGLKASSVGSA